MGGALATNMCRIRTVVLGLMFAASAVAANAVVNACTAFCATGAGQVLVGNNEDWSNPRTRIWFVPAASGSYGRMYVGFDDLWPQGGMNERGLWFDGFAAPAVNVTGSSDLPNFPGNLVDKAMAECATVAEVVRLFDQYDRAFLREGILMFADASGDAVSIEPDAMVRKTRGHFVQTNFHQSRTNPRSQDGRFAIATDMLERAGEEISIDLFRRILAATHQKGAFPTLYSNVYDLRSRTMHLYYFHDFERVVTFQLDEELKKGKRVLEIPSLFPKNAAAETFSARREEARPASGQLVVVGLITFPILLFAISVYGWLRAGRGFRIGLAVVAGTAMMAVVASVLTLRMHHQASADWIEFSIAPASGESASINPSAVRADGITLKAALATAYDIPAVRVVGPAWLTDTRYSIRAVVGVDQSDSFRSLLQQELKNRLRLETHLDVRPFDVFVLAATDAPRVERAHGARPRIWIRKQDAQLEEASMADLVSALQGILGKPVIDETGIPGTYNLEFGWGEDRVASVTSALRDRYGLRLAPGTREMPVLIVDSARPDPALILLAQVGRATKAAPQEVRQQIADILTVR